MHRSKRPWRTQLALWLLVMSFVLPQTTCTLDAPAGSTIVIDQNVALIAADLIRDVVFLRNADDDYFEEVGEHDHWWWW